MAEFKILYFIRYSICSEKTWKGKKGLAKGKKRAYNTKQAPPNPFQRALGGRGKAKKYFEIMR